MITISVSLPTFLYLSGDMMKFIFLVIASIVLIVLGMSFYMLNNEAVNVDLYFWKPEEPTQLALVMLITLAVGVLIGFFASLSMVFTNKSEIRRLKKIQKSNEEELTNLRNMPLKDSGISSDVIEAGS